MKKELIDIRNKLYNDLPTGEVNGWDLLQMVKWHINDLDSFIARLPASSLNVSEAGRWQLCPKCNGDGDLTRYSSPNMFVDPPTCDVCGGEKIIKSPSPSTGIREALEGCNDEPAKDILNKLFPDRKFSFTPIEVIKAMQEYGKMIIDNL